MLLGKPNKAPNPRWYWQGEKGILSLQPLTDANYYICYSYILSLEKYLNYKKKVGKLLLLFFFSY